MGPAADGDSLAVLQAELNLAEHIDLREPLASGDNGLYLGRDRSRGRWVVVKVEREPLGMRRLSAAARAMARLDHPGIQKLVAVGSTPGMAWMVTDLADRGSLEDLLEHTGRHPSSLHTTDVLRWLATVADGLAAAHSKGVLHGDVSPSNVLLTTAVDGTVNSLLGDFGSATVDGTSPPPGGHTPRYAAPERRRGALPTEASDVFGLCATALACLEQCDEEIPARVRSTLERGTSADAGKRPSAALVARRLGGG